MYMYTYKYTYTYMFTCINIYKYKSVPSHTHISTSPYRKGKFNHNMNVYCVVFDNMCTCKYTYICVFI